MTVGSILGDTWRFIRTHPRLLFAFTSINFALALVMRAVMQPIVAAQALAPDGAQPDARFFAAFVPMWLGMMLAFVVITNAVFRAVLRPDDSRGFYLRLGMDEVRLVGLVIVLAVVLTVAWAVILFVALAIGLGVATILGWGKSGAGLATFLVALAGWLGLIAVMVRFTAAAPLTLLRRKIVVGESWRLTRGHGWTIFGAYFALVLIVIAASMMLILPQMGQMMTTMAHPGDPEAMRQAQLARAQQMAWTPFNILLTVVGSFLGGVMTMTVAMPALITRHLVDLRAGIVAV